jgi:hypothetical protein
MAPPPRGGEAGCFPRSASKAFFMYRRLLVIPLIAALGACARSSGETTSSLPTTTVGGPAVTAVAPGEASATAIVILPEGAGAVTAVREQNYSNGAGQQITLGAEGRNLGENRVDISVQTGPAQTLNGVPIWKPSESGVKSEILNRMRGVQMSIVNRDFSNAYGPFGLAIGRMGENARCIFAWQYIADLKVKASRSSANPALVRIRLCQANTTVDELASYVQNMRIVAHDSFGAARSAEATTDVRGGATRVAGGGELDSLVAVRRSEPRVAAAPAPAPAQRVATRRTTRRAVVSAPAAPRKQKVESVVAQQPFYGANPYGQRYLAPVGGGAGGGAMAPMNMPTQASAPLSGDLPARAYRGPSGQAARTSQTTTTAGGDATHSIQRAPQSVYYTGPQVR